MLYPPVDELGEHLPIGDHAAGMLHLSATFGADVLVAVLLEAFLKVLGDAEEHADHAQRHDSAEILDKVEPIPAHEGVEASRGEFADLWFEGIDLAWRKGSGEQIAVDVVDRGIFEDQGSRRNLHAGLQNFQYHALGGAEGLVDRPVRD